MSNGNSKQSELTAFEIIFQRLLSCSEQIGSHTLGIEEATDRLKGPEDNEKSTAEGKVTEQNADVLSVLGHITTQVEEEVERLGNQRRRLTGVVFSPLSNTIEVALKSNGEG